MATNNQAQATATDILADNLLNAELAPMTTDNVPSVFNWSDFVTDSANYSLIGNQMAQVIQQTVQQFASTDSAFDSKMALAFGENNDYSSLKTAWQAGEFNAFPTIEIRTGAELQGANAAYAGATNTIYVSEDFLRQNASNSQSITSVLVEEFGHSVDWQVNAEIDSPGDEGAILASLILDEPLSSSTLTSFQQEDDSNILSFHNSSISVERSMPTMTYSDGLDFGRYAFKAETADYIEKFFGIKIDNSYEYNSEDSLVLRREYSGFRRSLYNDGVLEAGIDLKGGSFGLGFKAYAGANLGKMDVDLPLQALLTASDSGNKLQFDFTTIFDAKLDITVPSAYAVLDAIFDYDIGSLNAFASISGVGTEQTILGGTSGSFIHRMVNVNTQNDPIVQINLLPGQVDFLTSSIAVNTVPLFDGLATFSYSKLPISNFAIENSSSQDELSIKITNQRPPEPEDLPPGVPAPDPSNPDKIASLTLNIDKVLAKHPKLSFLAQDLGKKGPFEFSYRLLPIEITGTTSLIYELEVGISRHTKPKIIDGEFLDVFTPYSELDELLIKDLDNDSKMDVTFELNPDIFFRPNIALDWETKFNVDVGRLTAKVDFSDAAFINSVIRNISISGNLIDLPEWTPDILSFRKDILNLDIINSLRNAIGLPGVDLSIPFNDLYALFNNGQAPTFNKVSVAIPFNAIYPNVGTAGDDVLRLPEAFGVENLYGEAGNDTLYGNSFANRIMGAEDNDTIYASAGNDSLYGQWGSDSLYGEADDDLLDGGNEDASADFLYGGSGNDTLYGWGGDDELWGEDDNDELFGFTGADTLYGGSGADTLYGQHDSDHLYGGGGNDLLDGGSEDASADFLYGDAGNDTLYGRGGDDGLDGGDNDDVLDGDVGNDTLRGGTGNDTLYGRADDDILYGESGNDWLLGEDGNDRLYGQSGNDTLEGGDDHDFLDGGDHHDKLYGGAGSDTLYGQAGNDYLEGNSGNDLLDGGIGADSLYGGTGSDTLYGQAGNDLLYGQSGHDWLQGGLGSDYLEGNEGEDTLYGGADQDTLYGNTGDDWMDGEAGNDLLMGHAGDDFIDGGSDTDTVSYLSDPAGVIVNINETQNYNNDGTANANANITSANPEAYYMDLEPDFTITAGKAKDGYGDTDTLRNLENIIGSQFDDVLIGNDRDNTIWGLGGNDLVIGNGGNNILYGGNGIDTVSYRRSPNGVYVNLEKHEAANGFGGSDRLYDIENVIGSNFNDALIGDGHDNIFTAGSGNDYVEGGNGNDKLYGEAGDDNLWGGDGNDTLFGNEGKDALYGGIGDDEIYGGDGDDFVSGGGGKDKIYGDSGFGNDTLFGDGDNDVIYGGRGNDILNGGEGNDQLWGEDDDDILIGEAGDDFLNAGSGHDQLWGGDGNDTLLGQAGNDTLGGGDGNDTLDGGTGSDQLWGGEGSDTLLGQAGNDTLGGGDGNDQLTAGADDDVLYGDSGNDTLDGGTGNDQLWGGDDHDVLLGQAGNDTLDGGSGNDSLEGGSDNDQLFGHTGSDTLDGGTGDDSLLGGEGDDRLWGQAGQDTLEGGLGDDQLHGGVGNDTLKGEQGNDTMTGGGDRDLFYINRGEGIDTILDFGGVGQGINPSPAVIREVDTIKFTGADLTAQNMILHQTGTTLSITFEDVLETQVLLRNFRLENLDNHSTSTGASVTVGNILFNGQASIQDSFDVIDVDENLTQVSRPHFVTFLNDLHNRTMGWNHSDDVINGLGGNDTLSGLSGNDTLRGGEGNDVLYGGFGNDFLNGQWGDDYLDGGEGSDRLRGGDGNDYLVGSFGNDTLEGQSGNDKLVGGGGQDLFIMRRGDGNDTIVDFDGVGPGTDPSQQITREFDILKFEGVGLIAKNMLLTQTDFNFETGISLVITFEGITDTSVTLNHFALENLDNLPNTTPDGRPIGNVLFQFDGDDRIKDSFDVFDADWTFNQVLHANTVTFLNDLDNEVSGFDWSDDVINGQGGNDILRGFGGNDILRGGLGDDVLIGGFGNNILTGNAGRDTFVLELGGFNFVNDFTLGEDFIGLGDGLSFEYLQIEQGTGINAGSTSIRVLGDDSLLMSLKGVQANTLTTEMFRPASALYQPLTLA